MAALIHRWLRRVRTASTAALVLPLLAAGPAAEPARAGEAASSEYALKAVFLYHFTQFVQWPSQTFAAPDAPFVIGLIGGDPFGDYLAETVKGETVGRHPIVVRRLRDTAEGRGCQILFVAAGAESALAGQRGPVLTVGETGAFIEDGGIIRFVTDRNRVRLRINLRAAQAEGLTLSSKLLRVAEVTD